MLGAMKNKPAVYKHPALADWCRSTGRTLAHVARTLDVSQPSIYNWMHGRCHIPLRHAVELEKISRGRVPVAAWLEA